MRIFEKITLTCVVWLKPGRYNFSSIYESREVAVEKAGETLLYIGLVNRKTGRKRDDGREIFVRQMNDFGILLAVVCNNYS